MINIMIDVLKEKDPAEWLALKMVMSQEQIPKTTKEAVDIVKKLCNEAIEQSIQNLQAENEKLKKFARKVIKEMCFDGWELNGFDIQDFAHDLGLITERPLTEADINGVYADLEIGDSIFEFSDILKEGRKCQAIK